MLDREYCQLQHRWRGYSSFTGRSVKVRRRKEMCWAPEWGLEVEDEALVGGG